KSFAYKIMGDLYKTGVFVQADPEIAEKFYSKAIDLGDLSSIENYIDIITTKYLNKEIPNDKKNKIMELIKIGENNSIGNIFFIKAELISKGEIFPFDYDKIILNLSKALELGVGFAGFRLYGIQKERFYNLKRVGNIDFKLKSAALKSLKVGAKLGCGYCINEINKLNKNQSLFNVNSKNRNYVDSYYSNKLDVSGREKFLNKIFSNIADKYNLKKTELFLERVSFREFENFHKDRDNKLFLKFSNFKYEDEFRSLVTKDNYFNEDYTLFYYDLLDKKDFESINNIAIFYVFGCGVNRDIDKALVLFEQAAESGIDVANYNIALLNNVVTPIKRNDKYYDFYTYCLKAINSGAE
ncbi:SEL1-like repeat protein, partial [Acinetobacter sp. Ver3]|uniref:SEL1-like repeat protein n=1 Tax=Acinetobacter sp. Ver3 TaxID=466088 RepID=UPI000552DB8D